MAIGRVLGDNMAVRCPDERARRCGRLCRRDFLAGVGTGAVAASLPVAGCGGVEVHRLREDVEIDLGEYPELDTVGRTVLVELPQLPFPIALTRDDTPGDSFIVTGTECNHMGCRVDRDGGGWRCPCHGAQFGLDGSLKKGPATEDLVAYEYEVVDSTMTVFGYD